MAYNDLRDFIKVLEAKGLIHRVKVEVDPVLEIAEITDRMCKSPYGGKALFFEKVKGSQIPVVTNIFGSFERMCLALEIESLDDIGKRIEKLLNQTPPKNFKEKIKAVFELIEVSKYLPKKVNKAPCQEIIDHEPDLSKLPILKTWPLDGGRFITFPMVFTRDPDTGKQNCGMYRMHVYNQKTTGMHWHIHKDGATHYRKYKELGKTMPVAVAIGGDPAVIYSSTAPLPYGVDEMVFAGFLRRRPVEMVKCITSDIEVPANAEIVLEGYVEPEELRDEGPFGDHTGFYSPVDKFPVFHITCITHRKNPIYPATVVGKPPMEDCYMGKATERIFLPLLRMQFPEIVDMNLPMEGVFHNAAIISIKKQYPGHGKKIIHGLWGMGQMSFSKLIIVVDEDVDVQDLSTTAWKVLNNVDWRRDIIISEGPVDELDHASSMPRFGGKMGIDATRKMREEGMMRDWPEEINQAEEIKQLVTKRWHEYGF
jgi:4-hydroxy-3-polyprenylbenzoate decarboxylase